MTTYSYRVDIADHIRIMTLTPDGKPDPHTAHVITGPITVETWTATPPPPPTTAGLDALCRCGHRRRLHGGEGGSCEVFQCACTHFTATPPIPRTDP